MITVVIVVIMIVVRMLYPALGTRLWKPFSACASKCMRPQTSTVSRGSACEARCTPSFCTGPATAMSNMAHTYAQEAGWREASGRVPRHCHL